MERTKYRPLIALWLVFLGFSAEAGNQQTIYEAFVKGDMQRWKNTIDKMQEKSSPSSSFLLELINYQYGYIGWALGNEKEDEAEKYLNLAEENLEKIGKKNTYRSEYHSYKAAFLGFRIGLSNWKAPFLGPKSIENAEKAIALGKTNPMAYLENGNIQFYMPKAFGGSKAEAIGYYLIAQKLMERSSKYTSQNWNYLNLLVIIAKAYHKIGQKAKAKAYYEKILAIEPEFLWVKNELYPKAK